MKVLDHDGTDHLIDKIYDLINSGGSADYIVEEGTSGIWTYCKWASGIAECWGTASHSGTWTSWGSMYVLPFSPVLYPFNFVNNPNVQLEADIRNYGTNSCWASGYNGATDDEKRRGCKPALVRPTAGDSDLYYCHIHAKGFWKEFTPSVSRINPNYVEIYTANWTASQTTAIYTKCTDTLTLDKGKYIIGYRTPWVNTSMTFALFVNNSMVMDTILTGTVYMTAIRPFELTSTSTVVVETAGSGTSTFQDLNRGGLWAIKLSDL